MYILIIHNDFINKIIMKGYKNNRRKKRMKKQNTNAKIDNKYVRVNINRPNGITLVALVITIVVLIILAGVTINLTLGENGIFKKAEEVKQKESESSAREKLELVLVEANIEKETNTNYNKEDFLTEMLENNNITVEGDIVIVDNYIYLIDREKLEIVESLGETLIKLTSEVQEYLGVNENGKYEVSILLTIESDTDLQSILIQNPDGTTFEIIPEGSKVAKDLTAELDETYTIIATTVDGKTGTRKIIEKSVENIRTVEELTVFRDKVNTGLTYEGKTINLLNNLDLSSVCGANIGSWEAIGNIWSDSTHTFKGIFDGNDNAINNLYINSTIHNQGLFGHLYGGTIKNLTIDNSSITGAYNVGGIVGSSSQGTIENCHINKTVTIKASSKNNVSGAYVGGITGTMYGTVKKCSNKGNIVGSYAYVGGITGVLNDGDVLECYNAGTIKGGNYTGGITGVNVTNVSNITNCYNIGSVNGSYVGGIIGGSHPSSGTVNLKNVYNKGSVTGSSYVGQIIGKWNIVGTATNYYTSTQTITAKLLGDSFTDDIKNLDGTWKYNNGLPILKWQLDQ